MKHFAQMIALRIIFIAVGIRFINSDKQFIIIIHSFMTLTIYIGN